MSNEVTNKSEIVNKVIERLEGINDIVFVAIDNHDGTCTIVSNNDTQFYSKKTDKVYSGKFVINKAKIDVTPMVDEETNYYSLIVDDDEDKSYYGRSRSKVWL